MRVNFGFSLIESCALLYSHGQIMSSDGVIVALPI